MPEGDSLHRTARRLQVLVGERVEVETPHPRAAVKGLAERLDGRRLEQVEAVGKNLLLHFEGGLVLRSHLRMKGRWRVERRGTTRVGKPWLLLRGAQHEAVLWNGAVLEAAHALMRASVEGPRPQRHVYRRAGRMCPRCGGVVRSAPQGVHARTAYWCPGCQVGGNAPPS